jgi:hypothetical protein
LFFYKQINSHFAVLLGDPYDGVIGAILVGHWYKVLNLTQNWSQAFFFYPYQGTLGYNDSYLIYGVLALPFRLIGSNILIAQEYVHITVKAIGFLSMLSLLNVITAKKSLINIFGAALFVLMINSSIQAYHGQLISAALAPLLFGIALKVIANISTKDHKFLLWGVLFSIGYGAWLLTSFYMAWFFGLFCIVVFLVAMLLDYASLMVAIRELLNKKKAPLLALSLFFVVCTLPFLLIYIPKLDQTGGHTYQAALNFSPKLGDLINIGPGASLIWGKSFDLLNNQFPGYFRGGEQIVGFTPDVLFAITVLLTLYKFNKSIKLTTLQLSLIGAGVIILVLPISIHGWSLWWFIYHGVPGAKGVRVIARLWVFLAFPVSIAITLLAQHLNKSNCSLFLMLFFMSLMLMGQINTSPYVHLDVKSVHHLIEDIPTTPNVCQSFFVTEPTGFAIGDKYVDAMYQQNIAAMLIADHINLPTINGLASFSPPDWDFSEEPQDTYIARVQQYVQAHHIDKVCQYSIKNHTWKVKPFRDELK